ncbi:hypothetical protein PAMP_004312 [Pampus punctatissimus]
MAAGRVGGAVSVTESGTQEDKRRPPRLPKSFHCRDSHTPPSEVETASLLCGINGRIINSTESPQLQIYDSTLTPELRTSRSSPGVHIGRRKRFISQSDMVAILDYHNQVRANVFPPAANMEHMVWDIDLARTAEAWAATCLWEHGPSYLLQFYGQNLSVRSGGYQSILQLVKPWYDEVNDYVFPYPRYCNPSCPLFCYGPMCTHYTQVGKSSSLVSEDR